VVAGQSLSLVLCSWCTGGRRCARELSRCRHDLVPLLEALVSACGQPKGDRTDALLGVRARSLRYLTYPYAGRPPHAALVLGRHWGSLSTWHVFFFFFLGLIFLAGGREMQQLVFLGEALRVQRELLSADAPLTSLPSSSPPSVHRLPQVSDSPH